MSIILKLTLAVFLFTAYAYVSNQDYKDAMATQEIQK